MCCCKPLFWEWPTAHSEEQENQQPRDAEEEVISFSEERPYSAASDETCAGNGLKNKAITQTLHQGGF